MAIGPNGPLYLTEEGDVAALDGTVLAPVDPSGPAASVSAGPNWIGVITTGAQKPAAAQVLAGGSRIALPGIESPREMLAPDDLFVLGTSGGRPGVWRWGTDADPTGTGHLTPFIRGDVPLFPGGSLPESISQVAAGGGRVAAHVHLRGGGAGVVLFDGCALIPIVGDGEGILPDGTTVASPRAVGPHGEVLLAAPADLEGVWTLYIAKPD